MSRIGDLQQFKLPRGMSASKLKKSFFGEELIDEAQLAKELNDLSMQEREMVYDDIHGVAKLPEETPEFVAQCLQELDERISKLTQNKRKWLDRAFFLKRELEKNTDFKLMFLRADRYNASDAATRMAGFFQSKVELFGEDKLVKRITLDDLDQDAVKNGGWRHISKIKDRAGRTIVCNMPAFVPEGWKDNARFAWYQTMSALFEDVNVQIHGFVYILMASGCQSSPRNFIEVSCLGGPLLKSIPARWVGFHLCHNHPSFKAALAVTNYVAGRDIRLRTRSHYGSVIEIQYALMTFGISKAAIPLEADGTLSFGPHERYICERREIEHAQAMEEELLCKQSPGYVPYPKPQDVLVGRGRPFQEHIGNVRYLAIVDANMQKYSATSDRTEKSAIFKDVIRCIHESGGRFLQVKNGVWVEAPDAAAREKVSHSFRHRTPEAIISSEQNFPFAFKRKRND